MNTKVYGRHSKKFGGKKDCNDRIEIQRTDGGSRYEGIAGFYRGCTINLIKVTPGSAVSLAVYETVAQYLSQPNK